MSKYPPKSGRPAMEKAICDKCGKECRVPFKPTGDKPVYCSECFEEFGEKRFGRDKQGPGFGRRDSRDNDRRDSGSRRESYERDDREMYSATCDECGDRCEVPFRPSGDKPVYCSNCFREKNNKNEGRDERRGERRDNRSFGNRDERRGRDRFDRRERSPREMFDAICVKCGKDCKVPFEPTSGKDIYCSECFEKKDQVIPNKGTNYEGKSKDIKQLRDRIDGLSKKIDLVMEMLEAMSYKKSKSKKSFDSTQDKKIKKEIVVVDEIKELVIEEPVKIETIEDSLDSDQNKETEKAPKKKKTSKKKEEIVDEIKEEVKEEPVKVETVEESLDSSQDKEVENIVNENPSVLFESSEEKVETVEESLDSTQDEEKAE